MKYLSIAWLLLTLSPALIGQPSDPWQDFDKGPDVPIRPIVPEPRTYGLIMVGSMIIFVAGYEYFKQKSLKKDQSL